MRRLFRLLLVVCFLLFASCGQDECKTYYPDESYVDIHNMTIAKPKDAIFGKSESFYPLHLRFDGPTYAFNQSGDGFYFPLIKGARACPPSPRAGYKGSKEKVDSIRIVALTPFNGEFPKGSLVNPQFKVDLTDTLMTINHYLASERVQLGDLRITTRLIKKPDTANTFRAAFWVRLQNGETYRDTSHQIGIPQN